MEPDGEVELEVEKIIVHPNYDPVVIKSDFSILRIKNYQVIPDLRRVAVACLPLDVNPNRDFVGEKMKIVGWGRSEAGKTEYKLQVNIWHFCNFNSGCNSHIKFIFFPPMLSIYSHT